MGMLSRIVRPFIQVHVKYYTLNKQAKFAAYPAAAVSLLNVMVGQTISADIHILHLLPLPADAPRHRRIATCTGRTQCVGHRRGWFELRLRRICAFDASIKRVLGFFHEVFKNVVAVMPSALQ